MLKNKKGISLIVLVITIIVMIIIAGAIILSLNNSNVIAKAKEAKAKSDISMLLERWQAAYREALITTGGVAPTVAQINTAYGTLTTDYAITASGLTYTGTDATLKAAATALGVTVPIVGPPIPAGFIASTVLGETTIAEGFVIIDQTAGITGNEYVWIPVTGTLENERKQFLPEQWFLDYLEESFANLFIDDTASEGYIPMKTSVENNDGFYVSRYEAGATLISDGSNLAIDGTLKPLSQKDKYIWNNISWGGATYPGIDTTNGAAKVSKQAYSGSSVVSSGLLYGAQYDAMLNFIQSGGNNVTNSTTWGNYNNSSITINGGAKYSSNSGTSYTNVSTTATKPANTSWLLTTGASEQNKAKNIYDVAGNAAEWTYELSPIYGARVVRPGSAFTLGSMYPAASRYIGLGGNSQNGFRFALYIK